MVINECMICKKDCDGAFVKVTFRKHGIIQHGVVCTDGNRPTKCQAKFLDMAVKGEIEKV